MREMKAGGQPASDTKLWSSTYLNNVIERDITSGRPQCARRLKRSVGCIAKHDPPGGTRRKRPVKAALRGWGGIWCSCSR